MHMIIESQARSLISPPTLTTSPLGIRSDSSFVSRIQRNQLLHMIMNVIKKKKLILKLPLAYLDKVSVTSQPLFSFVQLPFILSSTEPANQNNDQPLNLNYIPYILQ